MSAGIGEQSKSCLQCYISSVLILGQATVLRVGLQGMKGVSDVEL